MDEIEKPRSGYPRPRLPRPPERTSKRQRVFEACAVFVVLTILGPSLAYAITTAPWFMGTSTTYPSARVELWTIIGTALGLLSGTILGVAVLFFRR